MKILGKTKCIKDIEQRMILLKLQFIQTEHSCCSMKELTADSLHSPLKPAGDEMDSVT